MRCTLVSIIGVIALLLVSQIGVAFAHPAPVGECNIAQGALCKNNGNTQTQMPAGECDISQQTKQTVCTYSPGDPNTQAITTTYNFMDPLQYSYSAVRSDVGALAGAPIDIQSPTPYQLCRFVDNGTSNSIFVPFNTDVEWAAFVNNAVNSNPGLQIVACSRPYTPTIYSVTPPKYDNGGCAGSPQVATPNIYARWYSPTNYATWPATPPGPETASFTCYNGATIVNAGVVWNGLDSDGANYAQSWSPVVSYGPDLELWANGDLGSTTITSGQPATLAWNANDANATCVALMPPSPQWTTNTSPTGSLELYPTTTTSYSMTCTDSVTQLSSTATVTVVVDPTVTANLTASPATILSGQSSGLSWTSQNAAYCDASGGWSGNNLPTSGGPVQESPTATTVYTLTCYNNAGGQASSNATVTVQGFACGADQGVASPNGPWNDNPSGLCSALSTYSNPSYVPGTWSWNCSGVSGACTAPITMPPFSAGISIVQKLGTQCTDGDRANNQQLDSSDAFGSADQNNSVYMSVGFALGQDWGCCGDQEEWNLGEYNAPPIDYDPPGTINWYKSSRFTIQWSGDIDNDGKRQDTGTTDSHLVIDLPQGITTENVTVTDTYTSPQQHDTFTVTAKNHTTPCQ